MKGRKSMLVIIWHLVEIIKGWFVKEIDMQKGELTVSGTNSVEIRLHAFPSEVKVEFNDEIIPVPCNPHHVDHLEYDVHTSTHHHKGFKLIIRWSVADTREITWKALY